MHIHLVGVSGTGMGALGGLLKKAGHRVTGSDTAFYPPIGDALVRWGVETMQGYDPRHLEPRPDLVVIGNVCRSTNAEARAAIDGGLRYTSFPGLMEEMFLKARPSYVVAGTHGKTTTSTLLAFLMHEAGADPGFLVGGIPIDFDESFRLGSETSPFVIEGDEYDSAFFEKSPKFWRYNPRAAILTSIEHDHIDIYPTMESYREAFRGFIERIPEQGVLVAWAGDPEVRALAKHARCRVVFYGLSTDDTGDAEVIWHAAPGRAEGGIQPFDLFIGGSSAGRVLSPMPGHHNIRNAVAAIALAAEAFGAPVRNQLQALGRFRGVRRRQELRGVAGGVRIYDDFAHHPSAVRETLSAIRARHPDGALWAIFEPRSATASRALHQAEYPSAFDEADFTLLAPVGRPEIPASEKLDTHAIARAIRGGGRRAEATSDTESLVHRVLREARAGDTIVIMSNGAFDGIHDKLLVGLAMRHAPVMQSADA